MTGDASRGQLVLLAAVVVVVALVPISLAYQQLGHHPDVDGDAGSDRIDRATRLIPNAVDREVSNVGSMNWSRRRLAARAVTTSIRPTLDRLTRPDVAAGTTYAASLNETEASRIASFECPRGPDRQFGTCRALGGVVVQRRVNQTAVVAVAVDVRATGPHERTRVTVVARVP